MVGEGEKSGCECGAGETAGDVGVGEGEGACRGGAGGSGVEKSCWSCCRCMSLSSCHRAWHCATEKPTRRATVAQLGRTKFWVFFEFDQATISVAVPSVPIGVLVQWWWGWLLPLACCGGLWNRGCCWSVV